jgi:hypothetical protein
MSWLESALLLILTAQGADHDSNVRDSGFHVNGVSCMEDWMSGLNQQFTKLSAAKVAREFESHIFRKYQNPNKA